MSLWFCFPDFERFEGIRSWSFLHLFLLLVLMRDLNHLFCLFGIVVLVDCCLFLCRQFASAFLVLF